jgi:hypothetical protein
LILAKGLGWRVGITLCGLGVQSTSVDFLLKALVVADLSLLLIGERGRPLQVWVRLQVVRV